MPVTGEYRAAAGSASFELREKGSRFLAFVEPCRSEDMARNRIGRYQEEFVRATHVCWAWRVGDPVREGRSDAGEPAGTAGPPMLQALRGARISDVLAVVVRWYGGVKLGKGGLARAYSGAVRAALAEIELCIRRPVTELEVRLPYERLGDLKRRVHPPAVEILEECYGEEVVVVLRVEETALDGLCESLGHFATGVRQTGN